ncbi:MAG: helix-turn-helix transcriptional regulator [Desulfohalobiaceae bacterium]|nr:helix-turn-helix transcriptional regulator [Desulfohalobiaceae bacterium]
MKHVRDIEVRDSIPASAVLPQRTPGTLLAGLLYREGLTQKELAEQSGIPRRHISEMENDRRAIGKQRAKRLADVLNADYRMLL